MHQILRRGFLAALSPDGAPNTDIIVTDIDSKKLSAVQVKTRRDIGSDKGWHMKAKHEKIISENLFYCFVDLGEAFDSPVSTHILPSSEVAKVLRLSHQTWLSKPGARGQKRRDSNMRRLLPDYTKVFHGTKYEKKYQLGWLDSYREKWELITG